MPCVNNAATTSRSERPEVSDEDLPSPHLSPPRSRRKPVRPQGWAEYPSYARRERAAAVLLRLDSFPATPSCLECRVLFLSRSRSSHPLSCHLPKLSSDQRPLPSLSLPSLRLLRTEFQKNRNSVPYCALLCPYCSGGTTEQDSVPWPTHRKVSLYTFILLYPLYIPLYLPLLPSIT